MDFIKRNWLKLSLIFYLFLPVSILYADTPNARTCPAGKLCNPLSTNTVNEFIQKALEGLLRIGIPLIAIAVIYSGFLFVEARGNSEKLTQARQTLLYTLIGAAILLGSFAIAKMIAETVNAI